ncbi:MAG: hypothetical protein CMG21_01610 [Candidatus Marinimicrobia bacterium]|nr:hypothetical protein [Candidatus Neomarinimicrobiota bacterium]|tara:strand:- start:1073 stop:1582 length:510 start_codon:yes stop_codon:yes gene_type:complete
MKFIKNKNLFMILYSILLLMLVSCGEENTKASKINNLENKSIDRKAVESNEWIGTFKGTCASYNMENQYGEEMIIYGNYVTVPSVNYKFKIYDKNTCSIYMDDGEDEFSCHNVRYTISSNYNDFSLTMMPTSDSNCGGGEMILTGDNGSYKIEKGSNGQPSYSVNKIDK